MPSWSGTLSGTTHAMTPVTTAAAPTQRRKKAGATISAAASSTPSDSHAQCGSMLASQSGISGSLAFERVAREFADAAQRADQLRRLDREEDRLAVRAGRELAHRLDIFLRDEIIDRLGVTSGDRVRDHLGRLGFGFGLALARFGVAEGGFAAAFGLQDLADRKSTRLNSSTNAHLVCRPLLEKKKNIY